MTWNAFFKCYLNKNSWLYLKFILFMLVAFKEHKLQIGFLQRKIRATFYEQDTNFKILDLFMFLYINFLDFIKQFFFRLILKKNSINMTCLFWSRKSNDCKFSTLYFKYLNFVVQNIFNSSVLIRKYFFITLKKTLILIKIWVVVTSQ